MVGVEDALTGGSWKGLFPDWALALEGPHLYLAILLAHFVVVNLLFGTVHVALRQLGLGEVLWKFKYIKSWPKDAIVRKEIWRTNASVAIDACYCMLIVWLARAGLTPMYERLDGRGWPYALAVALAQIIWSDFHFYATHRLLHTKLLGINLYKHVHRIHHESNNPTPWSSLSFHWIEGIIFFSSTLSVLVVPVPVLLFIILKMGMVLGPLSGHVGFGDELVMFSAWGHHKHHVFKNNNFGATGIWDVLCGTYTDGKTNVKKD